MKSVTLKVSNFFDMVKQLKKCKDYVKELEKANKFLNEQVDKVEEINERGIEDENSNHSRT